MGRTYAARRMDPREDPPHDSHVRNSCDANALPQGWFGENAAAVVLRRTRLGTTQGIDPLRLQVRLASQ